MHSNKCRNCGLVNAVSERICQRCGYPLGKEVQAAPRSPREAAKRSSSIYTILVLGLIALIVTYIYTAFEKSFDKITTSESNRLAAQPKQSPLPLTSRSEYDQRRAEPYKNAVANSQGLATSQKHNEDVKQLMQPAAK